MDPISSKTALAAAGAGGEPLYVDDVFSTFLYEGNASTQTITNGIDLSGEGGMVLQKRRTTGYWFLNDTENGADNFLYTNFTNALGVGTSGSSFNSDGFTIGTENNLHNTGDNVASWTFRKAPGFFDIVTYTGTGSVQNISHSLGSVPGMIIIKCTSDATDWSVYHRSLGATKNMHLNNNSVADTQTGVFNDTEPTATHFTVNYDGDVNGNGRTYVAYVFAHDDQSFGTDGDEPIIKCGSWSGTGSPFDLDIGFEAQWILYKESDYTGDWTIVDNMRGLTVQGVDSKALFANTTAVESGSGNYPAPYANGFRPISGSQNASGRTYIYMAIRRPHKPPEAGTDVFAITKDNNGNPYTVGFPTDAFLFNILGGNALNTVLMSRLTGDGKYLVTSSTNAEGSSGLANFGLQDDFDQNISASSNIGYNFRRAPGFFDVVAYEGTGTTFQSVNHNLEAVPELMLIKNRSNSTYGNWSVYYKTSTSGGSSKYLYLNSTAAEQSTSTPGYWSQTDPTDTQFTLGSDWKVNGSYSYIAYLFATLSGISKVGSYTGTGYDVNVDCGFTAGARYILIKRTDATGDWYVWDSTRGIISGNDPYLLLNSNAAEVTSTDYIDPLNAGFTVTSTAPAALNASGGTYLFLAIA